LIRMRELAIQASNGTLSDEDRDVIDAEFQALDDEINRIATSTEINSISLLNSSTATSIQVGLDDGQTIDVTGQDVQSSTLGINGLDVTDVTSASAALDSLDTAINSVSTSRGNLGASINRLS